MLTLSRSISKSKLLQPASNSSSNSFVFSRSFIWQVMQKTGNLYCDLAQYYDFFCAEVDYVQQCEFTQRAFVLFASSGAKDYLDLACGTGQHMAQMERYGFTVSGLDNSAEMLAQAAVRCPTAHLLLSDLASFTYVDDFDLITCFLYSIHYSHPTSALTQTLRNVYAALKPGGVFIFNAVDARGIRNDNGVITHVTDGTSQLDFQSAWFYGGAGEVLDLNLSITRVTAAGTELWFDHHVMTAVTLQQLQELLTSIGFEVTVLEHDYTLLQRWDAVSANVIYVASKPLQSQLSPC